MTSGALSVERIGADGTSRQVLTPPYRAHHSARLLITVRRNTLGISGDYFGVKNRSSKSNRHLLLCDFFTFFISLVLTF